MHEEGTIPSRSISITLLGMALFCLPFPYAHRAEAASGSDPVKVTKAGLIHVSGEFKRATLVRDGRGAISVFPVPPKPAGYVCKRIDIALVPHGERGPGTDGGEVWLKGGCEKDDPGSIPGTFKMVGYAKGRAERLCKSRNPDAAVTVETQMTAAFEVKRRYCFLDMRSNKRWQTDCEKDGVWVNRTFYFPVDVSCDKSD